MKSTPPLMFLPRKWKKKSVFFAHIRIIATPTNPLFLLTYYKDGPQSYFAFDQGLILTMTGYPPSNVSEQNLGTVVVLGL